VWLPSIGGPGSDSARVTPRDANRLRFLVDAWLKAKRNARVLLDGASGLCLPAGDARQVRDQLQHVNSFWGFAGDGALIPVWFDDTHYEGFDVSTGLFVRIAADVDRWRLSGPCRNPPCGKYFLRQRKTTEERKYCPHCRRYESGPRMRTMRTKQREALLRRVRQAEREWAEHSRREGWKPWVVKRVNAVTGHDSISVKGLTRWVNAGRLKAPAVKAKSRKGER
jgi:hypothetical protein